MWRSVLPVDKEPQSLIRIPPPDLGEVKDALHLIDKYDQPGKPEMLKQ
jgi:hypothetical protein